MAPCTVFMGTRWCPRWPGFQGPGLEVGEMLGLWVQRGVLLAAVVVEGGGLSRNCWKLSRREVEGAAGGAGIGEGVEAAEMDGGWERVFTICSCWHWRGG